MKINKWWGIRNDETPGEWKWAIGFLVAGIAVASAISSHAVSPPVYGLPKPGLPSQSNPYQAWCMTPIVTTAPCMMRVELFTNGVAVGPDHYVAKVFNLDTGETQALEENKLFVVNGRDPYAAICFLTWKPAKGVKLTAELCVCPKWI